MDFTDKKVLVVGLAISGTAAMDLLLNRGAEVHAYDSKNPDEIRVRLDGLVKRGAKIFGSELWPDVTGENYDFAVISPGVPLDSPIIEKIVQNGTKIIGELELAYLAKKSNVEIYAVTGTNGKTTTTALLEHIFKRAGRNAVAGGNIGVALSHLVQVFEDGVIVTETSSFQLDTTDKFHAHIAGIINITPDHLDRHKSMINYIRAKAQIFVNQDPSDYLVLNFEDKVVREMANYTRSNPVFFSTERVLNKGIYVRDGIITFVYEGQNLEICAVQELSLRGKHNLENVLCAVGISCLAGLEPELIKQALQDFPGVKHRMEEITLSDGILYINDSKGTNPESTMRALDAFEQPIILIAGGRDKGSDFGRLSKIISVRVKALVLLGEAREKIKNAVQEQGYKEIYEVSDLEQAVSTAYSLARTGDVVLLSPACASWDMFKSYEERGDLFRDLVMKKISPN